MDEVHYAEYLPPPRRRRHSHTRFCCCVYVIQAFEWLEGFICRFHDDYTRVNPRNADMDGHDHHDGENNSDDTVDRILVAITGDTHETLSMNVRKLRELIGGDKMFRTTLRRYRDGHDEKYDKIYITDVMHYCVSHGKIGSVLNCANLGFDVDEIGANGEVALELAITRNKTWAVSELYRCGADDTLVGYCESSQTLPRIENQLQWNIRETLARRGANIWICTSVINSQAEARLIALHQIRVRAAFEYVARLSVASRTYVPEAIHHLIVEFGCGPCSVCINTLL